VFLYTAKKPTWQAVDNLHFCVDKLANYCW